MMNVWGKSTWFSAAVAGLLVTTALGQEVLTLAHSPNAPPASNQVELEQLVSALQHTQAEVVALAHLPHLNAEQVQTVVAEDLINGNDESSLVLEESMMANESEINSLQLALGEHRVVRAVLQKRHFQLNQIVAMDVAEDGTVVLFCK